MLGNPVVSPLEQGSTIIEGTIRERFEDIRSGVSEVVEPFVANLSNERSESFDNFLCNLISGIDTAKAYRSRALQVAKRTYAVSQLVICRTFTHEPTFEIDELFEGYASLARTDEHGMIDVVNRFRQSFQQSVCFGAIMRECQPSIDPVADEPEVFELFGGFILQSAALGEAKRVKAELEASVADLTNFEGDLRELFEE